MNDFADEEFAVSDALELRILHGPQAGSTLPMEEGQSYTVGTADTCAVLLAGTQVEAEHAELSAGLDGIHVTPMQGRVMTIDRNEVEAGQVVALGTVLRLGRVKLTIDSVDAPWPEDDELEEPAPVTASTPEPDEAGQPAPPPMEVPAAAALPVARKRGAPRRRGLVPTLLLGGAAMLLMGAAVAAWVTSESQHDGAADAAASVQAAAPSAAASAPAPEARVVIETERLAIVKRFLDKRRVVGEVELSVTRGDAGVLRVGGAAATQAALTTVMDAARTELADAAPVTFAVTLRSELPARFEDRLRSAGLAPKFKVIRREPQMDLQALLTAPEVRAWENVFVEFTREYGSVLTIHAQVQQERDVLETQIETVVGGAFPYVVTTAGRRVTPGGVMEGRTLLAIREGELVFSDGLRVRYGY